MPICHERLFLQRVRVPTRTVMNTCIEVRDENMIADELLYKKKKKKI